MSKLEGELIGKELSEIRYQSGTAVIVFSDGTTLLVNTSIIANINLVFDKIIVKSATMSEKYLEISFHEGGNIVVSREIADTHPEAFVYAGKDG
jgi:hypothetical protein